MESKRLRLDQGRSCRIKSNPTQIETESKEISLDSDQMQKCKTLIHGKKQKKVDPATTKTKKTNTIIAKKTNIITPRFARQNK